MVVAKLWLSYPNIQAAAEPALCANKCGERTNTRSAVWEYWAHTRAHTHPSCVSMTVFPGIKVIFPKFLQSTTAGVFHSIEWPIHPVCWHVNVLIHRQKLRFRQFFDQNKRNKVQLRYEGGNNRFPPSSKHNAGSTFEVNWSGDPIIHDQGSFDAKKAFPWHLRDIPPYRYVWKTIPKHFGHIWAR